MELPSLDAFINEFDRHKPDAVYFVTVPERTPERATVATIVLTAIAEMSNNITLRYKYVEQIGEPAYNKQEMETLNKLVTEKEKAIKELIISKDIAVREGLYS